MADASSSLRARKIQPPSLYELCLTNLVNYVQKAKCEKHDIDILQLPDSVLMDVFYKMLQDKRLCVLGTRMSELDTFDRLLRFSGMHLRLLQCFQAVIEHGCKVSTELAHSYVQRCEAKTHQRNYLIHLGLRLGGFLNEAGWYPDAQDVLLTCQKICQAEPQSPYYARMTLECCYRLLNTQSTYCCFPAAAETYELALRTLGLPAHLTKAPRNCPAEPYPFERKRHASTQTEDQPDTPAPPQPCLCSVDLPVAPYAFETVSEAATQTDDLLDASGLRITYDKSSCSVGRQAVHGMDSLLPRLYKEFSALFFVRCDYNAAYSWSLQALKMLKPHTAPRITVDVLRACGKACVVKRKFQGGGVLVRQAVGLARRAFGAQHPRHAAALLDRGFYLLNVDSIPHSVAVYEEALATMSRVFGRSSLHVATAQEDLAYALYVLEYSSGRFYKAREHAQTAIGIIETLVPADHLLLASAKRVKALILEEIALDTPQGQDMSEPNLLEESEALHKAALNLSMMAFGEKNVQTAKHYGNLGRLYQSMQKFQDAEMMHLKAIAIKEELLGSEDYEVGLSIGHLASLYNYHMNMHSAAEQLYYRSIAISLKLFGERYSGLEYDYRGLVHVFTQLKMHERAELYNRTLHHWHELRELSRADPQPAVGDEEVMPLASLQACFFGPAD